MPFGSRSCPSRRGVATQDPHQQRTWLPLLWTPGRHTRGAGWGPHSLKHPSPKQASVFLSCSSSSLTQSADCDRLQFLSSSWLQWLQSLNTLLASYMDSAGVTEYFTAFSIFLREYLQGQYCSPFTAEKLEKLVTSSQRQSVLFSGFPTAKYPLWHSVLHQDLWHHHQMKAGGG